MIKYHSKSSNDTPELPPDCWSHNPNARCLKVTWRSGTVQLFNYQQFVGALLNQADEQEILKITFANGTELMVTGVGLDPILDALHHLTLATLSESKQRYEGVERKTVIETIGVKLTD